jgi:hypothetical protein
MTFVGIDYSKNSPGICTWEDGKVSFISVTRGSEKILTGKGKNCVQFRAIEEYGVRLHFHDSHPARNLEYSESEEFKIYDACELAKLVVTLLPDHVDKVGIEGFSYGARGNAVLDVAGYGYCIRAELLRKYGRNKLSIFAPSAVKRIAGKGNAGKPEMMEYFLKTEDPELRTTGFWKALSEGKLDKVLKPVDDLVDAYWVMKCTQNFYTNLIQRFPKGVDTFCV